MLKKIDLDITFKIPYQKPPIIKIVKPKKAELKYATKKDMKISILIDPYVTSEIELVYTSNQEETIARIPIQCCPSCTEILDSWPTVGISLGQMNFPLSICHICGGIFLAKRHLAKFLSMIKDEKRIIVPGMIH